MSDDPPEPSQALPSALREGRRQDRARSRTFDTSDASTFSLPNSNRDLRPIPLTQLASESPAARAMRLRDAPPPPDGYRYLPDGRLVPILECTQDLTHREAQAVFCEVLEITGSVQAACDSVGVTQAVARRHLRALPDFADGCERAASRHRDKLYAHAVQRATVGYSKPIVGGKFKDEIVGYEQVYSDTLLVLLLKRHFPEFRQADSKGAVQAPQSFGRENDVEIELPPLEELPREKRQMLRQLLSGDEEKQVPIDVPVVEATK